MCQRTDSKIDKHPVFLAGGSPVDRGAWQATVHGVPQTPLGN